VDGCAAGQYSGRRWLTGSLHAGAHQTVSWIAVYDVVINELIQHMSAISIPITTPSAVRSIANNVCLSESACFAITSIMSPLHGNGGS
jgi:hypothetical protein